MPGARAERRLLAKQVAKTIAAHPCGDCDACCTVKQVAEIVKPEGVRCPNQKVEGGCAIYAKRPQSCRDYNCLWRVGLLDTADRAEDENGGRPDRLGIVFDTNDDSTMIVAREVWEGAIDQHMPLLHELAAKGHVLYLVTGERRRMIGAEEKVKAIQEKARRRLPLIMQ